MTTRLTTLQKIKAHPAVADLTIESDFGRTTYWVNLKHTHATDNGGGQQSFSEPTLAGVLKMLRTVAEVRA
jgi:hypothetical protein